MKSLFLTIVLSMCLMSDVSADPFLICDDPPAEEQVESYFISINGESNIETPAPLHYDLGDISDGKHSVQVRAKNVWGEGDFSPLVFTKGLPSKAQGIAVSTE